MKVPQASHLLGHGESVYNGHLQGPVTLTPIAESLKVELSLPFFTTYRSVMARIPTTNLLHARALIACRGEMTVNPHSRKIILENLVVPKFPELR